MQAHSQNAQRTKEAYDVTVIGGGVVGCAVLRALACAGLSACLLEKGGDILSGASKGNSAILHTAFDAPVGSLEWQCMQAGYQEYLQIHEALNLPLLKTGALLIAWSDEEAQKLPDILHKAHQNRVTDVAPVPLEQLHAQEPHLAAHAKAALHVPGEYLIDPWSAPLAYTLQAIAHGAEVMRRAEVLSGERVDGHWHLQTSQGMVRTRLVVNCAGNYGDLVEAICRPSPFAITPRKGQFVVYDKTASRLASHILLPVPNDRTKGVVITRTIFGNLLVGPTAEDQQDRTTAAIDEAALQSLHQAGVRMLPALAQEPVTATYAGLRPASQFKDYQIEALPTEHWITVGGIRSTGLTASLGIGQHVLGLVNQHFQATGETRPTHWPHMPVLSDYHPRDFQCKGSGPLVCHCESVTRREIEAALEGPLPAGDLGGLKRRTRAGMGRCQGFYCQANVVEMATQAGLRVDGIDAMPGGNA
ncbi:NAD(P)/FAD-dependent oxidoreductase [Leeia oryzae]|uniref:NAD(P)/FAD-dependent oxidoreductase n=1 Tax=Leeia oryzae TaxID=356662 RepID=UPI00037C849A|nr:FAD-dependent oxidoreductase [Leeia oryzae]